ncbi:MAG: M20 aminoacylase family protein [Pseudomonadota bacterium]
MIPDAITRDAPALRAVFEDLHRHPEIGFEETRTARIVAEKLRAWGVDSVDEGLGGTGVVGVIRGRGTGNQAIGLRADMDALPIQEATDLPYASETPGQMHACGHDGHTTMLLGAAKYLSETRAFDGTAILIFQPAEEGLGGARRMLAEGLLERFPVTELYGIHNNPFMEPGTLAICKGRAMAGAQFFDIRIKGRGSHAAMPQQSRDPIVIAAALISQLQSIVSRNVAPLDTCVVSVTQVHAGAAYNVVPGGAHLAGTVRYFKDSVRDLAETRLKGICAGLAAGYDVEIEVDSRNIFDVLENDAELSDAYLEAAGDVLGAGQVREVTDPMTGSEDFADMLKSVPGAYAMIGHGGSAALHNPEFVLGTECLPEGAAVLSRIVERRLPLSA